MTSPKVSLVTLLKQYTWRRKKKETETLWLGCINLFFKLTSLLSDRTEDCGSPSSGIIHQNSVLKGRRKVEKGRLIASWLLAKGAASVGSGIFSWQRKRKNQITFPTGTALFIQEDLAALAVHNRSVFIGSYFDLHS